MATRERSRPTARERARAEMTAEITDEARRQLAEVGAAGLSLRSVARALGVASSALYRYYPSRDELLTALIIDAYDALGAAAEAADDGAVTDGAVAGERWLRVCRAVRDWARAHPHEWALVYGSPVVGYAAPVDTVEPATRIGRVLAGVAAAAMAEGLVRSPEAPLPGPSVVEPTVAVFAGVEPEQEDFVERAIVMWIALVGSVGFELWGHLHNVVTDHDAFFDRAMAVAADAAGITVPRDLVR
ncbi:MAG: TetR/AcrR family transcriptional regulator [Microthrixaceae bacterium]